MEQARTIIKNLTPYERTCFLQEFLDEYPLRSHIYCCAKCNDLGADDVKEIFPIFFPCAQCEKVYCERCDHDLLDEGFCAACRG